MYNTECRLAFKVDKEFYDLCFSLAKSNSQTLAGWTRQAMKEKAERELSQKNVMNKISYVLNSEGSNESEDINLVKDAELIKLIYNNLIDQKIEELRKSKK